MTEIIGFILKLLGFAFDVIGINKERRERFNNDIKHSLKKKSDAIRIYKARTSQRMSGFLKRKEIIQKRKMAPKTIFEKSKDEEKKD